MASGEIEKYTKKEQLDLARKLEKMSDYLEGISTLEKKPDLIFIPALQREKTAMVEANKMKVPIIAICDTNANPDKADYVIPANDDAVNSIKMIVELVGQAIKEGVANKQVEKPAEIKDIKKDNK